MVSNARLDLPEPERPVTTIRLSRGSSSEMFLRLCTRAPCTAIVVRGAALGAAGMPRAAGLTGIAPFRVIEECQLLDIDVALFGQPDGQRRLADQPLVGQVLTDPCDALHPDVPPEVVFDFRCRPGLAHLAQMIDHRAKQRRRALRQVLVD